MEWLNTEKLAELKEAMRIFTEEGNYYVLPWKDWDDCLEISYFKKPKNKKRNILNRHKVSVLKVDPKTLFITSEREFNLLIETPSDFIK